MLVTRARYTAQESNWPWNRRIRHGHHDGRYWCNGWAERCPGCDRSHQRHARADKRARVGRARGRRDRAATPIPTQVPTAVSPPTATDVPTAPPVPSMVPTQAPLSVPTEVPSATNVPPTDVPTEAPIVVLAPTAVPTVPPTATSPPMP